VRGFTVDREISIPFVDRPKLRGQFLAMDKTANARRLRQNQTLAEKTLWTLVRNRRLGGFKFLQQVAIDRDFADFVREAAKVIVELDGPTHDGREAYANRRTGTLELFGYVVLRFRTARVLADPDGAADDILTALRSASL
jgi:very-short-patch-repair endonuclease